MTRRKTSVPTEKAAAESAARILAASLTHMFRSPTSAVAYCGYVPVTRVEHDDTVPPDCPDCIAVYRRTVTPPSTYKTLADD